MRAGTTPGPAGSQAATGLAGGEGRAPATTAHRWRPAWLNGAGAERRARDREDDIPIALYGLKRGTVTLLTLLCAAFALFTLIPIAWIMINSTKTQANIFESFGFWFQRPFVLWHNFVLLFQNVDGYGIYFQWFGNTALYALLGGGGATVLATLAGYGFARFTFRGSRWMFLLVIGALLVPITAITVPLYLTYAKAHLINSIWGMILPSMVSPVGVYLMRTYVRISVPSELIDAARIDGAGEVRIFLRIALPLMLPGVMTVLLISVVTVWNNYFLPLIIFSKNNLYPLTVGLGLWSQRAQNSGNTEIFPLVVIGGLVTIIPLIALFLTLQRYWRSGLLLGSLAN
jgi:multiple sugar transport system permease protein